MTVALQKIEPLGDDISDRPWEKTDSCCYLIRLKRPVKNECAIPAKFQTAIGQKSVLTAAAIAQYAAVKTILSVTPDSRA